MHKSVLLKELVECLDLTKGLVVLDGTINGGGHARAVLEKVGEKGVLIGFDRDRDALARATENLKDLPGTVHLVEGNFRNLGEALDRLGLEKIDRAYFDLGLSSDQLELSGRGFSFKRDEPLLMTFERDSTPGVMSAAEVLGSYDEETLADLIYTWGEERFARKIAKEIAIRRREKPLRTTTDLVEAVMAATPAWYRSGKIHPATRTFQALRIVVNDEIESLREGLQTAYERLSGGGRMAVITFHSIEDRVVKTFFAELNRKGLGMQTTKKPIVPTLEEVRQNPRARSAKLRVFEKANA